jgi:hypothetical protein
MDQDAMARRDSADTLKRAESADRPNAGFNIPEQRAASDQAEDQMVKEAIREALEHDSLKELIFVEMVEGCRRVIEVEKDWIPTKP